MVLLHYMSAVDCHGKPTILGNVEQVQAISVVFQSYHISCPIDLPEKKECKKTQMSLVSHEPLTPVKALIQNISDMFELYTMYTFRWYVAYQLSGP